MTRTSFLQRCWCSFAISRPLAGAFILLAAVMAPAVAQPPLQPVAGPAPSWAAPTEEARQKESQLIEDVIEPELVFRVDPAHSKIVRTRLPVTRIAITDPTVVEVNEFGPSEFEIIGVKSGRTTMTIWFAGENGQTSLLRYLVEVAADEQEQHRAEVEYGQLESRLNEMFPYSQIQLIPIADKLIVRGQARDSKEAAEILALLGGQSVDQSGNISATGSAVRVGNVAQLPGAPDLQTKSIISLLHVPGEQQVMLKVRIAELTRSAARNLGVDFSVIQDTWSISNFLGAAGNITAILDSGDVNLFIQAFSSNGMGKVLAEPTLVTLSGQPATFLAGGEFAVPTAVGVDGVAAATTTFRRFGTELTFTPTVIDKDRIRLEVAPSFSTLNSDNTVDGIPGLDTRAVTTTVDLREGQWLAIAGLIQDEQGGGRTRVPFVGDIPLVGGAFGRQNTSRDETELVVLVSPELVHPLEPEQVPLLVPGLDVTDPSDKEFYWHQQIEGLPGFDHRSTLWPVYRHQVNHEMHTMRHLYRQQFKHHSVFIEQQDYYLCGPQGFSE